MRRYWLLAAVAANLWARTEPAVARFEVAFIKPAEQFTAAEMASPGFHRGLRLDPGRVDMRFMPLNLLIMTAYNVEPHRFMGPGWLVHGGPGESRIFDIQATLPPGSSKSQVREMLRSLLADRFKLAVHRETRQTDVMALVVAEKGPKLAEAPESNASPVAAPAGRKPSQDYDLGLDGEHFQVFGAGRSSIAFHSGPDGVTKVTNEEWPGGMSHYEDFRLTMDRLARTLESLCGMPVINATGLNGRYVATYDLPRVGTGPAEAMGRVQAGLAKLGLRLETRKAPLEFLVVDHVEKDPTPN